MDFDGIHSVYRTQNIFSNRGSHSVKKWESFVLVVEKSATFFCAIITVLQKRPNTCFTRESQNAKYVRKSAKSLGEIAFLLVTQCLRVHSAAALGRTAGACLPNNVTLLRSPFCRRPLVGSIALGLRPTPSFELSVITTQGLC